MSQARITFRFLSYWHAGTGRGEGARLDAVVARDADGLPLLPGRSVKGLMREGVQLLEDGGHVPNGTTARFFGAAADEHSRRFDSSPGELRFSDAVLNDPSLKRLAAEDRRGLFEEVASTRIAENGLADDETLRRIEVTVPLTLQAVAESETTDNWIKVLQLAAPLVRAAGSGRHRGFGRVAVSVAVSGAVSVSPAAPNAQRGGK